MNWKLIFQLSVFGLIMAFATLSLIPENIEFVFWLVIFIFCAYVIAKVCTGSYFLHGFLVSLVNCVWITGAHMIFHATYIAHHPSMAASYANVPGSLSVHPRVGMAIVGICAGIISGLVLGLFAFIASKIVKKKAI